MVDNNMQTPVSIFRSREPSTALSPGRVETLSESTARVDLSPQPPSITVATPESQHDEYDMLNCAVTPDRPEPEKNEHGQYICTFAPGCAKEVFDRKCEWTKHFDKHGRPYKCHDAACTKLQGFTYSGGLLRHQREVHGMHGGPKEALYCRFLGPCKRKSERGFTRKENRDEHERRVHNGPFDGAVRQDSASPRAWSEGTDARKLSITGKRKASEASETDIEELRCEMKRLREDNDELRSQVRQLLTNQNYQQQQLDRSRSIEQHNPLPNFRPALPERR